MNDLDDYDGQMIFGEPWGPKASWHLCYRWGKTPKNLTQETCPDWGSNSGPLRNKRTCYHLLHSSGHFIIIIIIMIIIIIYIVTTFIIILLLLFKRGQRMIGISDLWSGKKHSWNRYLTPVVNFDEVRRAKLTKSTLLTSALGFFQIF